jgi:hypothetical protein
MKFILPSAKIAIFTIAISISVMSQTASELRTKYGPPSESYFINPFVSLTAKFSEGGQACEMLLTERDRATTSDGKPLMITKELTAVNALNEIIPEAQRGAKIHSIGNFGNCFSVITDEYEKVIISRHEQLCESPSSVKRTVQILWKNRQCKGGELTVNTRASNARVVTSPITTILTSQNTAKAVDQFPCRIEDDTDYVDYKKNYRKYGVTENAVLLSLPQPELTPEAIEHRATGKMIIEAVLDPCGYVTNLVLGGHVPYGLTERAISAARKIKFKPAINKGKPVPQRIQIEYSFFHCDKAPICTSVEEILK